MPSVVYAERALDHLERALDFIRRENPAAAAGAVRAVTSAGALLAEHPLAGQRVHGDIRELVISFGATGFVALYRFEPLGQQVRILALRHQRELRYRP